MNTPQVAMAEGSAQLGEEPRPTQLHLGAQAELATLFFDLFLHKMSRAVQRTFMPFLSRCFQLARVRAVR